MQKNTLTHLYFEKVGMKFVITKTARKESEPEYQEVEIKTIEELLILVQAF